MLSHIVYIILHFSRKHKRNFKISTQIIRNQVGRGTPSHLIVLKLVLAAGLNQLFGLGLGQLSVVAGLHSVVTTALSLGTQVGSIAEHLSNILPISLTIVSICL